MSCINRIWIAAAVACLAVTISSVSHAQPWVPGHVVEVFAELNSPHKLSFGPSGVVYAGNAGNPDRIYRISDGAVQEYGDILLEDPDAVLCSSRRQLVCGA